MSTWDSGHRHEVESSGECYEHCSCGAVRRKRKPGDKNEDPWHACHLCVIGYPKPKRR